jgi:hypothetical protein
VTKTEEVTISAEELSSLLLEVAAAYPATGPFIAQRLQEKRESR